jgi:hypothetical protein
MLHRCFCHIFEKKHKSRDSFPGSSSKAAAQREELPRAFRMSAHSSSLSLRRGGRRLQSSAFDLLCPELLDSIVEKVARDSPSSFAQLARVDGAFRNATRRCSQTLVIWRPLKRGEEPRRGAHACKEMSLRPELSKLVVKAGHTNQVNIGLWEAVSKCQWTSIVTDSPELEPCVKSFSASQISLRRLDLDGLYSFHLNSDTRALVQAFPKLEELTVCGHIVAMVVVWILTLEGFAGSLQTRKELQGFGS